MNVGDFTWVGPVADGTLQALAPILTDARCQALGVAFPYALSFSLLIWLAEETVRQAELLAPSCSAGGGRAGVPSRWSWFSVLFSARFCAGTVVLLVERGTVPEAFVPLIGLLLFLVLRGPEASPRKQK